MSDRRVKDLSLSGIFGGIILLLALVPAPWGMPWGFITIGGGIAITIVHIPVLIGAIFGGKKVGVYLGLIFGLGSLGAAILYPGGLNVFFINPLVSVLPRVIFGFSIYYIFRFFNRIFKNDKIAIPYAMGVSTLVHTLLVVPILFLFIYLSLNSSGIFNLSSSFDADMTDGVSGLLTDGFFTFFIGVFSINFLIEFIVTILVGTPIVITLNRVFKEK
ncbi:hypothetical protein CI105_06625 [Candidatus Izimaplasma bacterium ZiA1]|uniref:ECF transporter S component n=1 Tax=Candidatus Izimoplasma sp. ZiA1 TaxID=2024899 RepID=UPI000BAA4FDA|nr:hypothetical protein CI105_06625 [Candidatus Izimaplasma bacterium ZiA1]